MSNEVEANFINAGKSDKTCCFIPGRSYKMKITSVNNAPFSKKDKKNTLLFRGSRFK